MRLLKGADSTFNNQRLNRKSNLAPEKLEKLKHTFLNKAKAALEKEEKKGICPFKTLSTFEWTKKNGSLILAQNMVNGLSLSGNDDEVRSISEVNEVNQLFPAAHKGVEIRYETGRGRYAVASEDIAMGTTIVSEAPVAFALHPDKYGSNCQNCFAVIRY